MTISAMTSTAAIQHMAYTLTALIAQSQQPDFVENEAYADIQTNFDLVATSCTDLAAVVWLKNRLCFGYAGDECTFEEVNQSTLDHLNFILLSGWRPGAAPAHKMVLSNMFELGWWDAQQITVTGHAGDQVTGTATITDTEGEFQIAFEWLMEMGEEAERAGLPAMVSITAARFTLPYEFSLFECDGRPLDTLEAAQEMDCALGFCAQIFNDVYPKYAPAEGANHRG
ncbi:hypothetical protein [Pantoea stewartii]|uniref:hypothetical protein n=1 Tax=Pantoea stewartii TaxID=66269 RepID=UPI0025A1B754|nr:hypothetical protein [Pantoea stewartii]